MRANTKPSNKQMTDFPVELAEKTLENVFSACNMKPNKTPISILANEHKTIMRFHRTIVNLCIIGLVFLCLTPFAFIRPQFNLVTHMINQNDIAMRIEVSQLALPLSVKSTINNVPIPVTKVSDTLYVVEITDNGELEVIVTGFNQQSNVKTAMITNLH